MSAPGERSTGLRDLAALARMTPAGALALLGVAAMAGHIMAQLAMPWLIGRIIDGALAGGRAEVLVEACFLLGAVAAVSVLFRGGFQLAFARWGERSLLTLKERMFAHLNAVGIPYLDGERTGRLQALFTNDAMKVGRLYTPVLREAVYGVLEMTLLLAVLLTQYGSMALLAAALIPIYVLFPLIVGRPIRAASRRVQAAESAEAATLAEAIAGVRDVRAFAREDWSAGRIGPVLREGGRLRLRAVLLSWIYGLDYVIYWAAVAGIYWLGGQKVLAGEMSVGALVALVAYLGRLEAPVGRLFGAYGQVQALDGPMRNVLDFLAVPPETEHAPTPLPPRPTARVGAPAVELRGVGFSYPGAESPTLSGVELEVPAGRRVAVVGASGAGKSTLIRLLLRFADPSVGAVRIDGRDLRDADPREHRASLGTVFQEPYLFSGTVADNIRLGREGLGDPEVERAARLAGAHPFITALPEGYGTLVGERGMGLSVGQRQRVAIARAALGQPRLVLLDEPTSALDAESEQRVREGLERLMAGRTSFIVAHRLATVVDADLIVVLESGRIVSAGTHRDLVRGCASYRRLHDLNSEPPAPGGGERSLVCT